MQLKTMKKHVPNLLTLGNLFCGIVAVLYSLSENFELAFLWLVAGIVFDFFDGFVARLLRVSSPLGVQLDSLADMITAGLVPGLIMFMLMKKTEVWYDYQAYGGFVITLASAYRLAKFNIDTRQTSSFIGLPTPANALLITSLAIVFTSTDCGDKLMNYWILLGITLLSSYLLNSEIHLFALKFKSFSLKENLHTYVFLTLSLILIIGWQIFAIPWIITMYILISIIWKHPKK